MNDLTLDELRTGLQNLLEGDRREKLDLVPAAPIYEPDFVRLLAAITALPPELRGLPLAALLKQADVRRDTFLRLVHLLGALIALCPTVPEDIRAAAAKMVATFAPSLLAVNDPYAVSAAKAEQLQPEYDEQRPGLATIPTPDGRSAEAWVGDYLDAALETGRLLSGRAKDLAETPSRAQAGALRGEAIGTLAEFRNVVARTVKNNPDLPRTLEADIFGLFDEMQRLAAGR